MKKLLQLLQLSLKTLSFLFAFCFCLGTQVGKAQYNTLLTFGNYVNSILQNGDHPQGNLTYYGKKLYGMTENGGSNNGGNIFCVDTNGNGYRDLHDFSANLPFGSLTISGHKMYGMVWEGGANGAGFIFSVDTNGAGFKDLFDFTYGTSGSGPYGSLTLVHNKLYGMAEVGGAFTGGTIFSIDTSGAGFTVLYNLGGTPSSGADPYGTLILVNNKLYGMTQTGGLYSDGVIFSFDTNGSGLTNLYTFDCTPSFNGGGVPYGDLTLVKNKLYGMTASGGVYPSPQGVVFSIDTDGAAYDTLMTFNVTNGALPHGSLTLMGGKLYGMTQGGGVTNYGLIFSIDTTSGTLGYHTIIELNDSIGDGPEGSLILANGILYGMTEEYGTDIVGTGQGFGTIFSIGVHASSGIDNTNQTSGNISVYPNPGNGVFNIKSEELSSKSYIMIYNMLGQKVFSHNLNSFTNTEIDLSSEPNGVYCYRISNENGNNLSHGKLVIQK